MKMAMLINQALFVLKKFFIFSIGITVDICCMRDFKEENPWKTMPIRKI